MRNEEAQLIVTEGLRIRKLQQEQQARERELEQYEREQLLAVRNNCAQAKQMRVAMIDRQAVEEKRRARRLELEQELEREAAATEVLKQYGIGCMGLALITCWTPIPWWIAAALILSGTVFPLSKIYRMYVPLED